MNLLQFAAESESDGKVFIKTSGLDGEYVVGRWLDCDQTERESPNSSQGRLHLQMSFSSEIWFINFKFKKYSLEQIAQILT